ncbi:hypothetical protein DM860_000774 [Cuscuta australis]|uniref:F-box domain-containing protein n=1 Tax=Cuscuta australis TaxID=267555 RepID=A0A328CZF9_9ASTE|nr:hypothetical protein DM860_000774 [Cuscuta australis]
MKHRVRKTHLRQSISPSESLLMAAGWVVAGSGSRQTPKPTKARTEIEKDARRKSPRESRRRYPDAAARLHAPLLHSLAASRQTPPRRKLSSLQVQDSRYGGMTQRPFMIENGVGDNEKKRRVLQDVESTVGGDMSQLPDEILEYILNKLILRDAVRASLVSSRWRHHVLSRPCLIFKTCSMFKIEGASEEKCVCSEYKDRFVRAVYDFLASYKGVRMKKLSVHFCMKTVSKNVVSDWMSFACGLGVEEVVFELYCEHLESKGRSRSTRLLEIFPSQQPIVLKHLELSRCDAFAVSLFTRLETLNLYYTSLDSHVMESVLSSGLVNLKTLRFQHSKLPRYLSLNSLPNLQYFVAFFCSGLEKIDVASLKLKKLNVQCNRTVSVGLTRVPNLILLSYLVHDGPSICHIFSKLPQILPYLEILHVASSCNWVEYMPESIATFSKLRSLKLSMASKVEDIMFKIFQFLKSCPRLSNLTIKVSDSSHFLIFSPTLVKQIIHTRGMYKN